MPDLDDSSADIVLTRLARFNATVQGLVCGVLLGSIIFVATNWLILKGGEPVGPHLALLGEFFIGYRVSFWNDRLQQALATSRSGMRASGDAFWLQAADWDAFLDYEADLTTMIADKPITLLCTYPLSVSKAGDIVDVAGVHHVAIAKRKRDWEVIKGWGITQGRPVAHQPKRAEALDAANRILSLSPRERQVLYGVAEGRSNKEIARQLGIGVRTVETHRTRLLERLEVSTSAEAVRLATLATLIMQA